MGAYGPTITWTKNRILLEEWERVHTALNSLNSLLNRPHHMWVDLVLLLRHIWVDCEQPCLIGSRRERVGPRNIIDTVLAVPRLFWVVNGRL